MPDAELHLPSETLQLSSKSGNEYAWRIHDIPHVIDAARQANLFNLGGQLQFWLPEGGICECYWIGVDTSEIFASPLSWREKVIRSASVALDRFSEMLSQYDFAEEGVRGFPDHLGAWNGRRDELQSIMHFVWYLKAHEN